MAKITVHEGAQVHVDATYGLRCPDAEALADEGVVTASAVTYGPGEKVDVSADAAGELEATGVAERAAKK